jgi:SAM-dependent methyltransferase
MSRWGVDLILFLNRLFPPLPMHRELHAAKLEEAAYQAWEYAEAERIHQDWGPEWDLAGKRVLDVGCGLGGKLAFYAQSGANRVIGLDLRPASARAAWALAIERGIADRVDVVVADAARLPFAPESLDVLVSVNVMEHVEDPRLVLVSSRRVLKRMGLAFLHFPPYFSPWGPHLEGWIHFPWPHLFFSERTLIAALRRIEARKRLDEGYISQAQVPWAELESLPELNKLTMRRFRRLLQETGWQEVRHQWLPFAYQFLRDRGLAGRALLALVQTVGALPGAREILTTKMVFVLQPRIHRQ